MKKFLVKYKVQIALIIISVLYYLFSSKSTQLETPTKPQNNFTELDAKNAILAVKNKYGVDMARLVEKMFRWETGHFKSGAYKVTGTAGMTKGNWGAGVPTDTINFKTNPALDSGGRSNIDFILWNPKDFALYLASYIKRHNGNYGRWFSTIPEKQTSYANKVQTIKAKFV